MIYSCLYRGIMQTGYQIKKALFNDENAFVTMVEKLVTFFLDNYRAYYDVIKAMDKAALT